MDVAGKPQSAAEHRKFRRPGIIRYLPTHRARIGGCDGTTPSVLRGDESGPGLEEGAARIVQQGRTAGCGNGAGCDTSRSIDVETETGGALQGLAQRGGRIVIGRDPITRIASRLQGNGFRSQDGARRSRCRQKQKVMDMLHARPLIDPRIWRVSGKRQQDCAPAGAIDVAQRSAKLARGIAVGGL